MSKVSMKVSSLVLQGMFALGERTIVDVAPAEGGLIVFTIDATDAPEGAVEMSPQIRWNNVGGVEMVNPGWRDASGRGM